MNKFIKFFGDIATRWWCFWSNTRFKNAERFDARLDPEDYIRDLVDVKATAKKIYENFKWTADGIDQLGDAITPPPQCYKTIKQATLYDDCDGFHSTLYHYMYNSDYECYLLSVVAIDGGHCVLIYRDNNKWRIVDYTRVYESFFSIKDAVADYNKHYQVEYNTKKVFYNALVSYNYIVGKFSIVNMKCKDK